jgi:hypothetical protein
MSLMQMLLGAGGRQNDATGGTITYSGDYQIHTFTSGGNFRVTLAGVPTAVVDVLVVGAGETGGEGGTNEEGDPPEISSNGGGGGSGGAGGRVISSATLTMSSFVLNTNYAVTVGTTNSASSVLPYNGGSFTAAGAYTAGGGGGGSPGTTGPWCTAVRVAAAVMVRIKALAVQIPAAPAALGRATVVWVDPLRATGRRVLRLLATVAAVAAVVVPAVIAVLSTTAVRAERFIRALSSCVSNTRTPHEPVPYIWRG